MNRPKYKAIVPVPESMSIGKNKSHHKTNTPLSPID